MVILHLCQVYKNQMFLILKTFNFLYNLHAHIYATERITVMVRVTYVPEGRPLSIDESPVGACLGAGGVTQFHLMVHHKPHKGVVWRVGCKTQINTG